MTGPVVPAAAPPFDPDPDEELEQPYENPIRENVMMALPKIRMTFMRVRTACFRLDSRSARFGAGLRVLGAGHPSPLPLTGL